MSIATEPSIEQRLAALEAAVAEMRQQNASSSATLDWLQKVRGIMKDKPGFREMVAYGRAYREADRPPGDDES